MPKIQTIFGSRGVDFEKTVKFLMQNNLEFGIEDPDATSVFTFRPKKWSDDVAVQLSYHGVVMITLPETYSHSMMNEIVNYIRSVLTLANGCDVELLEDISRRHMVVNVDVKLNSTPSPIGPEDRARASLHLFQIVHVTLLTGTRTTLKCDDNSLIYGVSLQSFEKPVAVSLLSEQNGTVSATITATSLNANEYYKRGSWDAPIGTIGHYQVLCGYAENRSDSPAVGSVAVAVIFKRFEP